MFSGAQISLYPMCDDYVARILGALSALDPYRDRLRIETDDVSTLLVGTPDLVFAASRDLFAAVAKTGVHTTMSLLVSRGCPGEPDDPICHPPEGGFATPPDRAAMLARVERAGEINLPIAAQFALLPLGVGEHMTPIYDCIGLLKDSGLFDKSKHFCSKLKGDAGKVFALLEACFEGFGAPEGHLVLSATVSANSPTKSA